MYGTISKFVVTLSSNILSRICFVPFHVKLHRNKFQFSLLELTSVSKLNYSITLDWYVIPWKLIFYNVLMTWEMYADNETLSTLCVLKELSWLFKFRAICAFKMEFIFLLWSAISLFYSITKWILKTVLNLVWKIK